MTTREQVLDYIVSFHADNGYAPAVRDIAYRLRLSTSTVHAHLRTLQDEGRITRVPGTARRIQVMKEAG